MANLKPDVSEKDHMQGSENATITMVEYGDYQCPHCAAAHPIIQEIQKQFGDELKFVFRNFPLENSHPLAYRAAIASEAAAKQNKFWEMHDVIFENQNNLNEDSFSGFAKKLNLKEDQFFNDAEDESVIQKVEDDFESGVRSGVNGTPSIFINGERYDGAIELEELMNAIKDS